MAVLGNRKGRKRVVGRGSVGRCLNGSVGVIFELPPHEWADRTRPKPATYFF